MKRKKAKNNNNRIKIRHQSASEFEVTTYQHKFRWFWCVYRFLPWNGNFALLRTYDRRAFTQTEWEEKMKELASLRFSSHKQMPVTGRYEFFILIQTIILWANSHKIANEWNFDELQILTRTNQRDKKKREETELMRPKTFHIDMNSSWFRWRVHWSCLARIEIPLQSTSEITHVDSIFYWMQKIWANLNGNWRRVECIHWRSTHWEDSHICFYFHTRFCCLKLKGCFHIGGVGFFPPSFLSLSPPKNRILRHDRRILFCFTGAG